MKEYNDGVPAKAITTTGSQWSQQTPLMNNLDIFMYEITAE
ncbi:MAG: hypothetical protein WDO19_15390 [Bacteroidota bacterium]